MTKIFLIAFFAIINIAISINIECDYGTYSFHNVGNKYRCLVKNKLVIESPDQVQIDKITGNHTSDKNNDSEIYFHINQQPIKHIPRGLEKFYKNLKGIVIWHTKVTEIHQDDLKNYPNLNYINLSSDKIEIIESDLFDYNPELEVVVFHNLAIFHIDSTTFDKLTKLTTLYAGGNVCTSATSSIDRAATLKVINSIKNSCLNSDYVNLKRKLENLIKISKNLNFANFQIFSQNLINFQEDFTKSKIANFSPLKDKLEELMNLKIKSPYEDVVSNLSGTLNGFVAATNSYSAMDDKLTILKFKQEEINQKMENMKHKIERDLDDSKKNLLKAVDAKIEDLESRITRKIEEILDEKLEKVMTNIRKIVTSL